ncbi:hypothetical protein NL108_015022 [Boleophthalmus pectinirostris]|nr:hypothetical protein NL108_015022 [Boleophthalmus pectinirostris]
MTVTQHLWPLTQHLDPFWRPQAHSLSTPVAQLEQLYRCLLVMVNHYQFLHEVLLAESQKPHQQLALGAQSDHCLWAFLVEFHCLFQFLGPALLALILFLAEVEL